MLSLDVLSLLAEEAAQPQGGLSQMLLPLLVIGFLWIFLIQRPGAKDKQARENQLNAMKKGDMVTSIGGICGKIESIDKESGRVKVRVDDNCTITFLKRAIDTVEVKDAKGAKKKGGEDEA